MESRIAIWNGQALNVIETNENVFKKMRQCMNNAYLEMVPKSYLDISPIFKKLHDSGIAILVDEEGTMKELPVTFESEHFEVVGDIGFVRNGSNFGSLTDEQLVLLLNTFDKYATH